VKVRTILAVQHMPNATVLRLECGHDRSIGGHVWMNGKPASIALTGQKYECHDGTCGGKR